MVFLSFKIVQFVLVSFLILKLFRICTFAFFFIKKDPQIECIFCLTKPDAAPANPPMFSQIVTHMLTAPHIGRSHTRPGHTVSVSHLPSHSHFRQVGNPGTSRSPGLRTDPVTPSLAGSCPSDRGHSALPGPPPSLTEPHNYFPRCWPLTLLLHTQNGTLHVPCVCPTVLHPLPPQHESTKTHTTSWNFLGDLLIA